MEYFLCTCRNHIHVELTGDTGAEVAHLDIIAGLVRRDQHFLTSEIVAVDRFESWLALFSRFSHTLSGHSEWHML